jgi:hypothetical protein
VSNLDIIAGRNTVLSLTNQSAATREVGDVVIIDTANNESFTFSATSNYAAGPIGVVDEQIGISSNGRVVVAGYARSVQVGATVSRGQYLYHSSSSVTAEGAGFATEGAFGYVLKGGSGRTPSAVIFPSVPDLRDHIAYASNSNDVSSVAAGGGSASVSRADHVHRGVTAVAHTSNTFYGTITLTTPGDTVGVTSPSTGTYALTSTGGSGSSAAAFAGCSIYHNTTVVVNNAAVPFNAELYDTDGFHDTSTNNSRVTIPTGKGGKYLVTYGGLLSATGAEYFRIRKNGAATFSSPNTPVAQNYATPGSVVLDLVAGDYIELMFTGNRTLGHASTYEAQMSMTVSKLG